MLLLYSALVGAQSCVLNGQTMNHELTAPQKREGPHLILEPNYCGYQHSVTNYEPQPLH